MEKRTKIAAGAAGAVVLLGLLLYSGISIQPAEDSVVTLCGEPEAPVPGVTATMFGTDISDRISVTDTTDVSKIGTYRISYTYRLFGVPVRTVSINSVVADMEAPEIELEDGAICFTKVGEEWSYPSYRVSDNYDSPEDIEITLEGDTDLQKKGTGTASLKACDTSGNCTLRNLKVVVGDASEADFKPENFDLEKLDSAHYLLEPGTAPASDSTFRELYWIGDSNILNLGKYDGLPTDRVIARYAMAPMTFDLPVYYRDTLMNNESAVSLVNRLQPKRILLMMGEAEAGSGDPLKLADDYGKCLDELQKACPSAELIVSAILPIRKGSTEAAASQEQINRVNYCLLQMCREKKIPMLCADKWLKDDSGYGIYDYYLEDGFHLQASHFAAYTDYVRYCLED